MHFKPSISTWTILTSAIAGIIGSGWLLGPLACARIAGPAAILSWILGGILMSIVAACFVMLVRAMPITGGTVRFFQLSYGHFAGFSFSWIAWLAWVAVSPIETMALLQYSSNYIPGLMTIGVSPVLTPLGMLAAIGVMSFITAVNSYGIRVYNRINTLILFFKVAIPVMTVGLLFSSSFHPGNLTHFEGFMPYGIQSIFSALPLAGVIYSFIGFNPAIQLAAELKNPRRAVPVAIFGALGFCMVLYSLIQIAFILALPAQALTHGWAALSFAGDNGPFVGLLGGLGFLWFVKALYVDAVISPFGTGMVQAMSTGRLTYAMGQNGYLPDFLLRVNKHNAPKRAMLFNLVLSFVFFLPFPSWQHMVGFLVSCLVLGYVVGPMSLAILSRTHREAFENIPQFGLQAFCLLAFYICNLILFWSGWDVIFQIVILFIIGYVILAVKLIFERDKKFLADLHILRGSWVLAYIIGMAFMSYFSSFGGKNIIPFGVDFGMVALFSVIIYSSARYLSTFTASGRLYDQSDSRTSDSVEISNIG
ncbi:MAG: hypothetical protein K0R12_1299 [Gammaproteobacteria bacterium]|jgi:amino acid transporter|nr:hypothetical protein [Gammaproteobacteria bacterium]